MATNRFGYSDDFVLKNGKVGINTTEPQEKLDVVGGIVKGQDLKVTGVSSFTSYEGFLEANHTIDESITLTSGTNSSLSGEIIVGTGVTVTIANVGLGTTTVGIGTNQTGTNTIDTDEIVSSGQGNIDSLKVYNTFTVPTGGTEDRPSKVKPGQLYYNKDFKTVEFWDGNNWRQVDYTTRSGRGVFAGGESPVVANIDLINIQSQGNATNFGDLSVARRIMGGFSSNIRGLWGGGSTPSNSDVIDYVTIASEGNAIDFGNLTAATDQTAACSSSTRGLIGGGESPGITNVIGYVEISTIGNALDFGDLSENKRGHSGMSSPTRGFFCGGNNPGTTPRIDVVTIASKGNAIKFGDRISSSGETASGSNATRGIISDTASSTNKLSFVTLASDGNASFFGELSAAGGRQMTTSSQTRVVIALGEVSPALTNTLEYVSISTLGNSQDFGDLTSARKSTGGCSDSHGGLGGF